MTVRTAPHRIGRRRRGSATAAPRSAPGRSAGARRPSFLGVLVLLALLVPAACAPGGRAQGPEEVRIRIFNSRFVPDVVEVAAGSTVRFVVVNDDPIPHELIIGDEAVQLRHEKGTETHHGDIPGEVSVPAGGTATTTFEFGDAGQRILMGCHLPGHYDYGMKGSVLVRKS